MQWMIGIGTLRSFVVGRLVAFVTEAYEWDSGVASMGALCPVWAVAARTNEVLVFLK